MILYICGKQCRSYLGTRQWSSLARWKLREYNELPHFFEERLAAAGEPTQNFLQQFSNPSLSLIFGFFAYVSGAFVAILLVLTIIDSSILVNIYIDSKPLLFYLALFSATLAVCRAFIVDPSQYRVNALDEVVKCIHYYPKSWKTESPLLICRDLNDLYKHKLLVFAEEIFSILYVPFVLLYLTNQVQPIIDFVKRNTIVDAGLGHVCAFSVFEKWDDKSETEVTPVDEKMNKSILAFAINHPNWNFSAVGATASFIKAQVEGGGNESVFDAPTLRPSQYVGDSVNLNVSFSQLLQRTKFDHSSRQSSDEIQFASSIQLIHASRMYQDIAPTLRRSMSLVL